MEGDVITDNIMCVFTTWVDGVFANKIHHFHGTMPEAEEYAMKHNMGKVKVIKKAGTMPAKKKETDREIALRRAPELKTPVVKGAAPVASDPGITAPLPKEGSRNDLMIRARNIGIKNFRVLNKAELIDVLAHKDDAAHVSKVVEAAVKRWRAGWSKGKK